MYFVLVTMKKVSLIIGICIVILALVSITFNYSNNPAQPEMIKIGVIAPLTGDAAIYGVPLQKGLDLAKYEINLHGGFGGKKVQLIYEDSMADPKNAVSAFNKLNSVDKVPIIIGDMFSSTTLAIAPLAQKNKILLLSPTASSQEVPNTGDYIFSIYPSDNYDGNFIADFTVKSLNKKNVSIIYAQADAMIGVKNAFRDSFTKSGGMIIAEESYVSNTNDFRTILIKIKAGNPEVIFIPGYLEDNVKLLKQAKELGITSPFITISTAYDEKLFSIAGNSADNLMLSAPFYDSNSQNPKIVAFQNAYKIKYGDSPNVWAAYGYDSLNIINDAQTQSLKNSVPLAIAMSSIKDYDGVTGKTTFSDNRTVQKQLRMMIVRNSSFVNY